MEYEIIEKSWSKRRKLDTPQIITHIEFINFVKAHNHFCKMRVVYDDNSEELLISRVIYNQIKQHWTIDGMKVAVRVKE